MEAIYLETIGCTIAYDELGRVCIVPADTRERVHLHMAGPEGGEGDWKSGERKIWKHTAGRTSEETLAKFRKRKREYRLLQGLLFCRWRNTYLYAKGGISRKERKEEENGCSLAWWKTFSLCDQLSTNRDKESLIFSPAPTAIIVVISWLSLIKVSLTIVWLHSRRYNLETFYCNWCRF